MTKSTESRDNKRHGGGPDSGKNKPSGDQAKAAVAAAPAKTMEKSVVVEHGTGFEITKISKIDVKAFQAISVTYFVTFDGHDPIPCERLGQARDLAKAGPQQVPTASSLEAAA